MQRGRTERFGPVEPRRARLAMVAAVAAIVAPIAFAYPAEPGWRPATPWLAVSAAEARLPEPSPVGPPTLGVPADLPVAPDPSASSAPRGEPRRVEDCGGVTVADPASATAVAQMVHRVFRCVALAAGLGAVPPSVADVGSRTWDGAAAWGFASLADQVAAEAVVVGYCESGGFDPWALGNDNRYGYGGLFQMGDREWTEYGDPASSKFDPVANTVAAARYFVAARAAGDPWEGWGPWAVVNTDYGGPNAGVRVPVLPRFVSTDARYRGAPGPELPVWAVDPWSFEVPPWRGCPLARPGQSW